LHFILREDEAIHAVTLEMELKEAFAGWSTGECAVQSLLKPKPDLILRDTAWVENGTA